MFDLRQLRYFVEVAETLSFTQAAQRLHISQPPLSQQIQALEADLGVRLLDRNRRRVALTEPGRIFLIEAKAILARAESARTVVAEAAAGFTGNLRLASALSISFHRALPETLIRFSHAAAGVSLHLVEMPTNAQYDALLSGQIDVGLLRAPPEGVANARQLKMEVIDQEPLVLALPAGHRLAKQPTVTMADLAGERFVAPPRAYAATLIDRLNMLAGKANFRPNIYQEAQQIPSLLPLVAAGMGVALVPASLRAVSLDKVAFVTIDDPEAWMLLAVGWRADNTSPVLEIFLRTVREARAKLGLG